MNRGLIGFLLFLAVILLGLAAAAYVLGPNVLAFVFHTERRTEPVVIVNLLAFVDAQHAERYQGEYVRPAVTLTKALGGRVVWTARVDQVLRGHALDVWSSIELVGYPSRAAFIELVTSSDYRALLGARDEAVKRGAMFAGTSSTQFDAQGTRVQVIRFLTAARDDSIDAFDAKWLDQEEALLARHDGRLLWRARLNPLVADDEQSFDTMLIYGFGDAASRAAWTNDAERETLQTLQRRLFRRDVLVLAESAAD
jgi:uncharacterized protein (DUF1330 family)